MNDHSFAFYGFAFFGIILARYFILAGGTHLFLYRTFSQAIVSDRVPLLENSDDNRLPPPWTSFAFDPPEAIVQSLFLVAIIFIIPLHFITVIAVLITMTVWAIVNHLGLDRLPINFPHHWCGRWFTGPAHHAIHHHHYALHYGLYFTFWDRQLGTQSPQYDRAFADVTHGTKC